jgi:hypothetical protein
VKKLFAIILVLSALVSLAGCSIIKEIQPPPRELPSASPRVTVTIGPFFVPTPTPRVTVGNTTLTVPTPTPSITMGDVVFDVPTSTPGPQ